MVINFYNHKLLSHFSLDPCLPRTRTAACSTRAAGANSPTCRATVTSRPAPGEATPSGLPGLTSVMPEMLAGAEAVVAVEVAEAVEAVELVEDAVVVEAKALY
jgi:hypothetical protein